MNKAPLFSIVMPCYKGARFLPQAIESCLRQTQTDFELIVVDDASPDNCGEIAEKYACTDPRVSVMRRTENGGVSQAFNTGFGAARGELLTRLAQDDLFAPNALEVFSNFLATHSNVGLMYCDMTVIDDSGSVTGQLKVPEPADALLMGNRLGICVAFRKTVWDTVGGFNLEYDTSEDYDYWLRTWERFTIAKCPNQSPMYLRFHHAMGSVRFARKQEATTLRLLRESYPTHVTGLQRFLLRRRAIARVLYSAAADRRDEGSYWDAFHRILRSILTWPLPFHVDEVRTRFGRLKLLLTLIPSRISLAKENPYKAG